MGGPEAKPWFWRVRGTKFIPASAMGWGVLLVCLVLIIGGINLAVFSLLKGGVFPALGGAVAGLSGLGGLMLATAKRSAKHPKSRWRD